MLYDRRWDRTETKPDVFSLESLMAWLEKQPEHGKYCFLDTGDCLFFKYLTAMGNRVHSVGGDYYREEHMGDPIALPRDFLFIAACQPHTFGAALERTRAAMSSRVSSADRGAL